jgi:hypothetical protein
MFSMLRVLVPTISKYYWALRPFAYLFNTFWSELQPVIVAGYKPLGFSMPDNFAFYSIDKEDYPKEKWSDGIIKALRDIPDEFIVLLLEDYWLSRGVQHAAVASLHEYMKDHRDVLRMDLTADRLYAGGMYEIGHWGSLDIVETGPATPYQMSLQAGIWNKELLLRVLRPGLDPWQVEIGLSNEVQPGMRILGSRQWPVRYANVFQGGDPNNLKNLNEIPQEQLDHIRAERWIE